MKRAVLLSVIFGLTFHVLLAQTKDYYTIVFNIQSTSNEPIKILFNGLDEYSDGQIITTEIEKDCGLLIRQKGRKSEFVHIKRADLKSKGSDLYSILDHRITVNASLKPQDLISSPDFSNTEIPQFVKLQFDDALAHTFKYLLKILDSKNEGQMDISGMDEQVIAQNTYKIFRDRMGKSTPENDLFGSTPKQTDISTDLLLAGRVKFITNTQKGLSRTLNLAIEWNIYSKAQDSIIFRDVIDTEFEMDKYYSGFAIYDAISMSIEKLLDYNQDFHNALVPKESSAIAQNDHELLKIKTGTKSQDHTLSNLSSSSVVTVLRPDGGHGSGFIISESGYILTNYHVAETYAKLDVTFNSGLKLKATTIRKDKARDVALLKIDVEGLTPIPINPNDPELGSNVTVVGTPASVSLGQSISKGVVSGIRIIDGSRYFQTDASVNPGNSGGPVLNESLEVIGIVVMKIADEDIEGINFAIPIKDALESLNIQLTN